MNDGKQGGTALWNNLHEILGLDLRSLALFRVLLGLLLLAEIVARLTDVRAFYTDAGIVPRDLVRSDIAVSLHILDGSLAWQLVLFGLQAVFALMLLVGWQTRLAAMVSWFLLISLIARNPVVHYNGDTLMKMALFFAMFLPIGAVWSVDARFRPRPPGVGPLFVNAGTIGYLGQMCLVYVFAVLWKFDPEWRTELTAVHYALHIDSLATDLAKWIRQFPNLTYFLTIATMITEASAPLLLLFPFANQWTRLIAVVVFLGLHASFGACLAIGNFAPVMWVGWIILLPPLFWDLMARWCRRPAREGLTIVTPLPPGQQGRLQSLLGFLLTPGVKLRTAEPGEAPRCSAGWWLQDATSPAEFQGGAALWWLLWQSPLWWPLAAVSWPVLGGVARWLGQPREVGLDAGLDAEAFRTRELQPYREPVLSTLVLFCLIYTVAYNAYGLNPERYRTAIPRQMITFGHSISLDQGWGVFAPSPGKYHGWFMVVATFADGRQLDLIQNREPDFDRKPDDVRQTHINARWRRIFQSMSEPGNPLPPHYAEWVRKEWNRTHSDPADEIVVLEIYFMATPTTLQGISEPKKIPLYRLTTRSEDRRPS